jgi:hypothetical protein
MLQSIASLQYDNQLDQNALTDILTTAVANYTSTQQLLPNTHQLNQTSQNTLAVVQAPATQQPTRDPSLGSPHVGDSKLIPVSIISSPDQNQNQNPWLVAGIACYRNWVSHHLLEDDRKTMHQLRFRFLFTQPSPVIVSTLTLAMMQSGGLRHQLYRFDTPLRPGKTQAGNSLCYVVAANVILAQHPILLEAAALWHRVDQIAPLLTEHEKRCLDHLFAYQQKLRQIGHCITHAEIRLLAMLVTMVTANDSFYGSGEQHDCVEFLSAMLLLLFRVVHSCGRSPPHWNTHGLVVRNYSDGAHFHADYKWDIAHSPHYSTQPVTIQELLDLDVNQTKASYHLSGIANAPAVLLLDINALHILPTINGVRRVKHQQCVIPTSHLQLHATTTPPSTLTYSLVAVLWHEGRSWRSGHYATERTSHPWTWVNVRGQWQLETPQNPSRLRQLRQGTLPSGVTVKLVMYQLEQTSGPRETISNRSITHPKGAAVDDFYDKAAVVAQSSSCTNTLS